jgi:hypothetical protein
MKLPSVLLLLILLVVNSSSCIAQDTISTDVIGAVSRAVVLIRGETPTGTSLGSGVIISTDGTIVTALHVIEQMTAGAVELASKERFDSFSVVSFDARRDLAIIRVPGFDLPAVKMGNSNNLKVGQSVIAMGSPRGLQGTVTAGIVSAIREDLLEGVRLIQTDAAVNPGNSGGPLLSSSGELMGIVTAKLKSSEALNFAVPVNYVRGLLGVSQPPIDLVTMRTRLATNEDIFTKKQQSPFPSDWKSLISGNQYAIRRDGQRMYIEWKLAEAAKKVGSFAAADLLASEDGVFRGTQRLVIACTHGLIETVKRCPGIEHQIELTTVTNSRIEGRLQVGASFDCGKCQFKQAAKWSSFVWIPK